MTRRTTVMLLVLSVVLSLIALPAAPAFADAGAKALNTASNTLFGWTNCLKAMGHEVAKGQRNFLRGVAGAVVTGPIMCGVNVAATYATVPIDAVTIPWGKNILPPAAHQSADPPIKLDF